MSESSNPPCPTANTMDPKQLAVIGQLSALSCLVGVPFGNILGPVLVYFLNKGRSKFLDEHMQAAINFHLNMSLWGLIVILPLSGAAVLLAFVRVEGFLAPGALAGVILIATWYFALRMIYSTIVNASRANRHLGPEFKYRSLYKIRFDN